MGCELGEDFGGAIVECLVVTVSEGEGEEFGVASDGVEPMLFACEDLAPALLELEPGGVGVLGGSIGPRCRSVRVGVWGGIRRGIFARLP